jgi:hypothetical protein
MEAPNYCCKIRSQVTFSFRKSGETDMAVSVQVLYPVGEDTTFDYDY